jgi:hypothetical protein
MSVQIDEKTEVTIPLKTLISIVSALLIASWYVFTTQSRISDLEHTVKLADERFSNYIKQPGREKMEVELLKKDLSYLQTQIEELKHRGK